MNPEQPPKETVEQQNDRPFFENLPGELGFVETEEVAQARTAYEEALKVGEPEDPKVMQAAETFGKAAIAAIEAAGAGKPHAHLGLEILSAQIMRDAGFPRRCLNRLEGEEGALFLALQHGLGDVVFALEEEIYNLKKDLGE